MTTGYNTYKDHPTAQILPTVTPTQLHFNSHLVPFRPPAKVTTLYTFYTAAHQWQTHAHPPPHPPLLSIIAPSINYSVVLSPHRLQNYCSQLLAWAWLWWKYPPPTPPLKERETDREEEKKKGQDTKIEIPAKIFHRAAGRLVDKAKSEQNTTSSHMEKKKDKSIYAENTFGQSYWKVSRQSQAREEQWWTPTLTPPASIEMTKAYAECTTDLDRVTIWTESLKG